MTHPWGLSLLPHSHLGSKVARARQLECVSTKPGQRQNSYIYHRHFKNKHTGLCLGFQTGDWPGPLGLADKLSSAASPGELTISGLTPEPLLSPMALWHAENEKHWLQGLWAKPFDLGFLGALLPEED